MNASQDDRIRALSERFPWPASKPDVLLPPRELLGWFRDSQRQLLTKDLSPQTRIVVELGSWLGMSTRFIAEQAPKAMILAVDHWRGSPEHHQRTEFNTLLPLLFETFQALCWGQRARIIPMRMSSLDGLQAISDAGLVPDLIYVDADHSYEAVCADLALSLKLFPETVLDGDDFEWPGVAQAVRECATRENLQLGLVGRQDRAWTLRRHRPNW